MGDRPLHGARHDAPTSRHDDSIGEMSDRARDVFRMVVESYLESGASGRLADHLAHLPSLNLSPASIRNVMQDLEELGPARRAAHLGRADADRERPAAVRRRRSCRSPSRGAEDRAAIEARLDRGGPIEEAICQRHRRLVRPFRLRRHRAGAQARAGAAPARLRAAVAAPGAGGDGRQRRQRREPGGRPAARRHRRRRSPRSAIMSARASPA